MKKSYNKIGLMLLVMMGSFTMVNCTSDDSTPYTTVKPGEGDTEEPEVPAEKATIDVELTAITDQTVSFTLGLKDATMAYYYIVKEGVTVSEGDVLEKGTQVSELDKEQTVEHLEGNTSYTLYVAALNKEEAVTWTEKGIAFQTKEVVDVNVILSDIDSTHERVLFSLTPVDAKRVSYWIVEKADVEGYEVTADDVFENGNNIVNLKVKSTLKPKVNKANTDYVIYAAGLSHTDKTIVVSAEVKTKEVPTDPVDDGVLRFEKLNFVGDEVNKTVVYDLYLINDEWEVIFTIGAAEAKEEVLKEGKYVRNAKQDPGRPGPDQVGKSYTIKNKKTNANDTDIDYGDIVITKSGDKYKVVIDMVRKSDFKKHFIAEFNGIPVVGQPRP